MPIGTAHFTFPQSINAVNTDSAKAHSTLDIRENTLLSLADKGLFLDSTVPIAMMLTAETAVIIEVGTLIW